MKITKTENASEGKIGALRAKFPGTQKILIDERGKLAVQVTVWVPDAQGNAVQHEIELTDGDVERLLHCLSNPGSADESQAVGKLMRENLRSLLRLSALGSGASLLD